MIRKKHVFLFLISVIFLIVSFYKLDELPGEWFGDISNVHEYTSQILKGEWPFYFFQSPGPVYHYLIAPIVFLRSHLARQGETFLTYKIASILVGMLGIVSSYLLAKELQGVKIGLLAAVVTSVSFWFIVWARLGNSQIIIPALTALTVYFAHKRNLFWGIVVSSLGLFTYPQTFVLPIVFLFLILLPPPRRSASSFAKASADKSHTIRSVLAFIPAILLFISIVSKQQDNFTRGYVGEKIFRLKDESFIDVSLRFTDYLTKTVTMLHLEGDRTFRVNVPGSPHLDPVSGIFFILGLIYFLKFRRKELPFVAVPLFILVLPSVSPAITAVEIPSMSRNLGIIPFVYLLVASGIFYANKFLPKYILLPIIIILVFLNLQKYFIFYPKVLPDQNVPYGKIIARYIDTLPQNTEVRLTACCWGEAGQPEPKAIYYVLKNKKDRKNIVHEKFISSCDQINGNTPTLMIFNPKETETTEKFKTCFPKGEFILHGESGQAIFSSLYLK